MNNQLFKHLLIEKGINSVRNPEILAYKIIAEAVMKELQIICKDEMPKEKQVYWFSMEWLPGHMLSSYLSELGWKTMVQQVLEELHLDYDAVLSYDSDPALGNGGLGRLSSCFLDSSASLGIPVNGMGIRYNYGLFKQSIVHYEQYESPDKWLNAEGVYPFEFCCSDDAVTVKFGGEVHIIDDGSKISYSLEKYHPVSAVPYIIPVLGENSVNYMTLWKAVFSPDMNALNRGDYDFLIGNKALELINDFLYPNDEVHQGKELRLKQEYFLTSAGLQYVVKEYKNKFGSLENFEKNTVIHINDTHPALCVPELMRILLDEENYEWDEAWKITQKTITFTNHTVMPEALEKWTVDMIKTLLPRIFMIIEEIDRRFLEKIHELYPAAKESKQQMAVIQDGMIHMANLAIIGSHSVNGVAELHSKILREDTFEDFYDVYPERFHSVTNGVSPRRFLISANPKLAGLISDTIGDGWTKAGHLFELKKLLPYAEDSAFCEKLADVKHQNKVRLAEYIFRNQNITIDPDSIFDIQIKRIHEYKRQLLNALHVMHLYNQLKANPDMDFVPKTFFFAGKAAPSYHNAKDIIKLINVVAHKINHDPVVKDKLRVIFIPNFNVSIAEMIYPAAEISEQISTAGKEASGTGNMKFMMNGAITLGTMDGANVEIAEAVGKDNIFTFGLSEKEVTEYQHNNAYHSFSVFEQDIYVRKVMRQLIDGFLDGVTFPNIYDSLLIQGDPYFVLKDFAAYADIQKTAGQKYFDGQKWQVSSVVNIANSGIFSSDRSVDDYWKKIWE